MGFLGATWITRLHGRPPDLLPVDRSRAWRKTESSLGIGVHDQHGDGTVVQHVMAHAAKQHGAQRTASTGAHDDEVVVSGLDLVDSAGLAGSLLCTVLTGNAIGDPLNGFSQDRLGFGLGVARERRRHSTAVPPM